MNDTLWRCVRFVSAVHGERIPQPISIDCIGFVGKMWFA